MGTHTTVVTSLEELEKSLVAVVESEKVQLIQKWLADIEKQAPDLVVAIARTYLDSFSTVKIAKGLSKGLEKKDTNAEALIADLTRLEWEQKLHAAFPELKDHSIIFVPKEEPVHKSEHDTPAKDDTRLKSGHE